MTWRPHDLRLARALSEQRLEAARRARVNLKRRLRGRGAPEHGLGLGYLHWPQLHRPIHLYHAAHGVAGHH